LTIGVLRPDFDPDGGTHPHPTPSGRLEATLQALDQSAAPLPQAALDSAFLLAGMFGYAEPMENLLRHGAAVEARDLDGLQVVHLACIRDHVAVLRLVLSHGADPTAKDGQGRQPMGLALAAQSRGAIAVLAEYGVTAQKAGSRSGRRIYDMAGWYQGQACRGNTPIFQE